MTRPLRKLGFLHIVPFRRDAPGEGLEEALRLFEYGEELGFDGGWVRTRHIQYGLPSAAVFLAAAASARSVSSSAPPSSRRSTTRRCGSPRTCRSRTCCPAGASSRASASGIR